MKKTICILTIAFLTAICATAQKTDTVSKPKHREVTITSKGIYFNTLDNRDTALQQGRKAEKHQIGSFIFDLGINYVSDRTDYNSPSVRQYLSQIPASRQNTDLFRLKQEKSVNVNIYPLLESFRLMKKSSQRLYFTTGLGLQFYNFRYDNNITYTHSPSSIFLDSINYSKNKVAMNFINVPLLFTYKTKLYSTTSDSVVKDKSLVLGCGITGGYGVSIWTKQVSSEHGKVKAHDQFDFNNFNSCLMFEIGIENLVRFYGTYQLSSMYNNGIRQYPYSIGMRIIGL